MCSCDKPILELVLGKDDSDRQVWSGSGRSLNDYRTKLSWTIVVGVDDDQDGSVRRRA